MEIRNFVRENIKLLKPYTSARDSYNSGVLLDANENAFGSVISSELQLNRYPDPKQNALREKAGKLFGINPSKLFFGVGSDEIIDLLIRVFCESGRDSAMILEPTYGMYKVACEINNVRTKHVLLNSEFQIDFDSALAATDDSVKLIFLCSPNNPTGNIMVKKDISELCRSVNSLVVVDEAYIDFAEQGSVLGLLNAHENLIVLRTFSKAWGLAGVRCGYCAAEERVIEYLFKIKAPYNLNKLTTDAVLRALGSFQEKQRLVDKILEQKEFLLSELIKFNKIERIFPSDANFILIRLQNAVQVQEELAENGVIIRNRSNMPGLENCLRITVGTEEENNLLINLLGEIL